MFGRFFFFFWTTGDIVFVFTYPGSLVSQATPHNLNGVWLARLPGSLRPVWKDAQVRGLSAPLSPHDRRLYELADDLKDRSP